MIKVSFKNLSENFKRYNFVRVLRQGDYMYNYKIEGDVTKKVLSKYNSGSYTDVDELIDKLKTAESSFLTLDIPEYIAPEFEKMDKLVIDKEDIKKQAEDSLFEYRNSNLNNIENNYINKEKELNENKTDLISANINAKEELSKYYDTARENASNDALKRGLARSSIIINKLDAFNNDEINTYKELDKEYNDNLMVIEFELNSLTKQKQQAINDFDIAYAVKLNDAITKLNADLAEKQAEIIKYNNEIAEKEKKYLDDYNELVKDIKSKNIDKDADLMDLSAKYGSKVIENYRKNLINEIFNSYAKNMEKEKVLDLLNNNEDLRKVLGSNLEDILNNYK